jgi:AcrR family transcriptional regulator
MLESDAAREGPVHRAGRRIPKSYSITIRDVSYHIKPWALAGRRETHCSDRMRRGVDTVSFDQDKRAEEGAAGRPRNEGATRKILAVALALAEASGFEVLTVEGIAARAGVGKATIYRRWPNAWAIVVDAVLAEVTRISPVVKRETARESLATSMKLVAKSFRGRHGRLFRPLIGRAQSDATLRAAIDERWLTPRRELSRAIIRLGIETGEFRFGLDPDIVIDALYGPLYHRLLLPYNGTAVRLSDAYVDDLLDTVLGGVENST